MDNKISRRKFIGNTTMAAAGFSILPSNVISGLGHKAPSDKLNIVGVGVGGRGAAVLRPMEGENIIGLCDVDWRYSKKVFDSYPNAKKYWDYRKMYDEIGKDIDAVVVATSDHTHAIVAADAMTMGKHVYVEKPLTHTVYESRLLTNLAKKHRVATQMGNQGASGEGVNLCREWIANGEIGEVTRVDSFTNRPIWPQGLNTPAEVHPIPDTMNWDLFIGPAPMRPYNEIYTPWNFRGWWDFGTGALGDMACHVLHPVFMGLELGYPVKVQGSSTLLLVDCAPVAQKVKLVYPERKPGRNMKIKLPEVVVNWYDGGIRPEMPDGWPAGKNMNDAGGAVIFYGTKDILVAGCYGRNPWLMSGRVPNAPKFVRRVPDSNHYLDWVRACKENPGRRTETASAFHEAGPFNEMVVMGVLAVRLQELHKELHWDGKNMRFTNIGDDEKISTVIADRFTIVDGHPSFTSPRTDPVSAKQYAADLIKRQYRAGWNLPAMP
jgi:hypothetical protein